jgi:hypothetical protein
MIRKSTEKRHRAFKLAKQLAKRWEGVAAQLGHGSRISGAAEVRLIQEVQEATRVAAGVAHPNAVTEDRLLREWFYRACRQETRYLTPAGSVSVYSSFKSLAEDRPDHPDAARRRTIERAAKKILAEFSAIEPRKASKLQRQVNLLHDFLQALAAWDEEKARARFRRICGELSWSTDISPGAERQRKWRERHPEKARQCRAERRQKVRRRKGRSH